MQQHELSDFVQPCLTSCRAELVCPLRQTNQGRLRPAGSARSFLVEPDMGANLSEGSGFRISRSTLVWHWLVELVRKGWALVVAGWLEAAWAMSRCKSRFASCLVPCSAWLLRRPSNMRMKMNGIECDEERQAHPNPQERALNAQRENVDKAQSAPYQENTRPNHNSALTLTWNPDIRFCRPAGGSGRGEPVQAASSAGRLLARGRGHARVAWMICGGGRGCFRVSAKKSAKHHQHHHHHYHHPHPDHHHRHHHQQQQQHHHSGEVC